jgi:hypothetical protein
MLTGDSEMKQRGVRKSDKLRIARSALSIVYLKEEKARVISQKSV